MGGLVHLGAFNARRRARLPLGAVSVWASDGRSRSVSAVGEP